MAIAQLNDNANYIYETLSFDHYKPHFFSLELIESGDEPLHIIVAQQTPLKPKERTVVYYGVVRVLISSVNYDANNQPIYSYVDGKSLSEG